MPVTTIYEDGTVTAFLSGDIDHHTAAAMRETIDQTVESSLPQKLIVDFKDVTFGSFYIDGAGVEPALVGAITETTEKGKVSAPVKGISGVYLFEVTAIDPAERQQTAEDEKVRAEAMAEGMMQQRLLPALQEMAEMKDLSGRYF